MVLGSGSSGNCTLVEGRRARILIDCGLSARETARRLRSVGCEPSTVTGMVVSHEHGDHVRGASLFSRRFGVPIWTTAGTARAAGIAADRVAGLTECAADARFEVGDLEVRCFSVPHDAADNIGMIVSCEGTRLGYATDLGHTSRLVTQRLMGCDILIAESNHDRDMLVGGPYPWSVKQRILGRHGHLSNAEMESMVTEAAATVKHLFLAHLSGTNNTPALALDAARRALRAAGREGVPVHVAAQHEVSEVVET